MRHIRLQLITGALLIGTLSGCSIEGTQTSADPTTDQPSIAASAAAAPVPPTPTFVPVGGQTGATGGPQVVRIEDTAWQGSYRRATGTTTYGGRTATWIYGTGTDYATMSAEFRAVGQPTGEAELVIEGMDAEDRAKIAIQITINGTEIFNGANPLPNDDLPLETGTWATQSWPFDAALLKPGANTITIQSRTPGQFSRPPFFMLDYAEVRYTTQ